MRNLISLAAMGMLSLGLTACIGDDSDDTLGTTTFPTTTTTATGTTTGTTTGTSTASGSTGSGTTTASTGTTTASTGTSTASTGGSTTGAGGNPEYPMPDMMTCDAGYEFVFFTQGAAGVCLPECMGAGNACPAAASGTAVGACAVDPDASGTTCSGDGDCTMAGESCVATGGGGMACLGTATHCVLVCDTGTMQFDCPDGMTCSASGACEY